MLLLTHNAAEEIDGYLINTIGAPVYLLVEHAALAVAESCARYLDKERNCGAHHMTHVFAGKGMNGQDAYACARILSEQGYEVAVWEVFPDLFGSEEKNLQKELCLNLGIEIKPANEFKPAENILVVDGIFGTAFSLGKSFSADLSGLFRKISKCRELKSYVMSIDLPSGVVTDTGEVGPFTIAADETITFFLPKIGIYSYPGRKYSGEIKVNPLGFSFNRINRIIAQAYTGLLPQLIDMDTAKNWMPGRAKDGHKGTFGRAGIIGGSRGMAGSVCLSVMACMHCGIGLAYLRVPAAIIAQCLAVIPEALISSDYEPALDGKDAVLIGPGMDKTRKTGRILWNAVSDTPHLVLDAQALNILAENPEKMNEHVLMRKKKNLPWIIMTPHHGEFKRIAPDLADFSRIEAAAKAAIRLNAVIVLKGAGTVVAAPDGTVFINSSGNSAMAKGGSGDVLSGMITAFLAQGKAPLYAAAFAVYLHGLCGDLAARESGEFYSMPSNFITKLPEAFSLLAEEGAR